MGISLLGIILLAVLIYLIFFVLPIPVQLRNILGIILVIVLFVFALQILGVHL